MDSLLKVLYKTWTLLTGKDIYIVGLFIDMFMASLILAQAVNVSLNWIWMQVKLHAAMYRQYYTGLMLLVFPV